MSDVKFSILIPSITERAARLAPLLSKLHTQADGKPVEIIAVTDNRVWPVCKKRNLMMRECSGRYLTHLDDDDDISDDYINTILREIDKEPDFDVLCFNQVADLGDDMPYRVRTSLSYENEQSNFIEREDKSKYRPDIKRKPWHWCVWKSEIARKGTFPDKFMGEDWEWIQQVLPHCSTDRVIDTVLHYYFHRQDVSLSR